MDTDLNATKTTKVDKTSIKTIISKTKTKKVKTNTKKAKTNTKKAKTNTKKDEMKKVETSNDNKTIKSNATISEGLLESLRPVFYKQLGQIIKKGIGNETDVEGFIQTWCCGFYNHICTEISTPGTDFGTDFGGDKSIRMRFQTELKRANSLFMSREFPRKCLLPDGQKGCVAILADFEEVMNLRRKAMQTPLIINKQLIEESSHTPNDCVYGKGSAPKPGSK